MTGSAYPASRSRRHTSCVAIGMATASTASHPLGANSRTAIAIAPSSTPTAIAAGKLRPARDVFVASGSATEFGRSVCLDLEQLAFFVLDELVDLPGVGVGGLLEFLLGVLDFVLAGLAVLFDPVQLLHRLAADVAHRHAGVLTLGLGLLDEVAAALLGELRNGHPDHVAVIRRVDAEVGIAN